MKKYLQKRLRSFSFAFKGLCYLFKNEPNAKIHLMAGILANILGFIFHISLFEWIAIWVMIGLVTSMEAINSAIEQLGDEISELPNDKIGKAKDLGAAAVLICSVVAILIGLIIFLPKLWNLIFL